MCFKNNIYSTVVFPSGPPREEEVCATLDAYM